MSFCPFCQNSSYLRDFATVGSPVLIRTDRFTAESVERSERKEKRDSEEKKRRKEIRQKLKKKFDEVVGRPISFIGFVQFWKLDRNGGAP